MKKKEYEDNGFEDFVGKGCKGTEDSFHIEAETSSDFNQMLAGDMMKVKTH
uniref:Uncharacterized protein n=1 Tax=Arundo donax TaxID=35708 RepID=A0A0A8YFS9_ARUDO